MKKFYANGKLLLTAEYFVLDGALSLAVPTKFGQSLQVKTLNTDEKNLHWISRDADQTVWFEGVFKAVSFQNGTDAKTGEKLSEILQYCQRMNPDFLKLLAHLQVTTQLSFPRNWGLGTSSTLIYNIAQWAGIDPYKLQFEVFGGSGYDIACADASSAILYQKLKNKPSCEAIDFEPPFEHQLYFVYLGKKQNSREGIARYRERTHKQPELIEEMTALTNLFLKAKTLLELEQIIVTHENLVATTLQLPKVKSLYFNDYWGAVKSLGAWGGDFVLATSHHSENKTVQYFADKGFKTVLNYKDMVLRDHQKKMSSAQINSIRLN